MVKHYIGDQRVLDYSMNFRNFSMLIGRRKHHFFWTTFF